MKKSILLLVLLALIFSSCLKTRQTYYPYFYKVFNGTESLINVYFTPRPHDYLGKMTLKDTLVVIAPGEEKTLLAVAFPMDNLANPEREDTLKGIHDITILLNGSLPSKTNFMKSNKWNFNKVSNLQGELDLYVKPDDF